VFPWRQQRVRREGKNILIPDVFILLKNQKNDIGRWSLKPY
jgi:hypothetical protein